MRSIAEKGERGIRKKTMQEGYRRARLGFYSSKEKKKKHKRKMKDRGREGGGKKGRVGVKCKSTSFQTYLRM